ncbi:MAG: amidase [Actinomycetota bacterium]|nr:amidase [Actinomycetota bacterium]
MDAEGLAFSGIAEQARLLADREISSRELVDLYLGRIERIDPELNAFSKVFADAARDAAALADKRLASGDSAPLLGVPVAIKDELDIVGEVATHGTRGYEEPAAADAEHVRRLRKAGAIILGKTHLPELAIVGFTETDHHGVTRNPWDPSTTPGGSSGGSAAAVAAGLVGAATASDGAGSIRIPAANTGLFGLKPQRGRISFMPDASHWYGMSKQGCLTRRVEDTALWLDVAAGAAPGDAHTPPPPERAYVESVASDPGELRIAVSTKTPRALAPPIVTDEVDRSVTSATETLRDLGHTVVERDPDYGMVANNVVALYLSGIAEHYESVPHPERLDKRTRGFARMGRAIPKSLVSSAIDASEKYQERIGQIFDDVDVLMTPVVGELAVPVGKWEGKRALSTLVGMSRTYPFTATWNYTGQPAAAIPVGLSEEGLPLSVMLISPPNREDLLFSLAAQMESAIGWPDLRPPVA